MLVVPTNKNTISYKWLVFLLLSICACRVALVPPYDPALEQQILQTSKASDMLYLTMIDADSQHKYYEEFSQQYLLIEADINAILLSNETRPKADEMAASVKLLRNFFVKAKEDHKKRGVLNDAELMIYNEQLKGFWKPVLMQERALRNAKF